MLSNAISGCLTVRTLTVSAPSGLTNTLALRNAGTLSTPLLIEHVVTVGGGGVITVTNSALEVDTAGSGGPAGVDAVLVGVAVWGNTLAITNGGQVNNSYGFLGFNSSSSNNVALVTGSGSVWSSAYSLYAGDYGAGNQLTVTNGGQVVSYQAYLGVHPSSSNNVALVTGSGSIWSNSYDLYFGYDGASNQLIIANGGQVINNNGFVGYETGNSNNLVLVTGSGSVWSNGSDLSVGYSGAGNQVIVTNGGTVFANNLVLGRNAGSSGTLTLAGGAVSMAGLIATNARQCGRVQQRHAQHRGRSHQQWRNVFGWRWSRRRYVPYAGRHSLLRQWFGGLE